MKKKRSFKRILLVALLMISITISSFLFSGCKLFNQISSGNGDGHNQDFSDDEVYEGDKEDLKNEESFKVAYKPESDYTIGTQYQLYVTEIIGELVKEYGNGYKNGVFSSPENLFHFDSIRYFSDAQNEEGVDYVVGDTSKSWLWTFDAKSIIELPTYRSYLYTGLSNGEGELLYKKSYSDFELSVKEFYFTHGNRYYYINWYCNALEMVMYDILLGKTPREFEVSFNSDGTPSVVYDGLDYANELNLAEINAKILQERANFNKKATYVGFAEGDMETLKTYILEKVIGEAAVTAGAGTEFDRHYEDFLDNLFDSYMSPVSIPVLDFRAYPYATYKDTKLLSLSTNADPFSHIVSGEYNSLVYMPTESDEMGYIWFCFQSDEDVTLKMYFRYYNASSGVLSTTANRPTTVTIKAGAYRTGDYESVDIPNDWGKDGSVSIDAFDNNELRVADEPKQVVGVGSIYKTISSINGFGGITVLDESKVDFSFVEVVFDIVRNDEDFARDYNFKMAIWLRV